MKHPVYLITGAAGFIGSNLTQKLLKNAVVIGIDNFFPNYDLSFKQDSLDFLKKNKNFFFYRIDIRDKNSLTDLFQKYPIDTVFHLAALTGVRKSVNQPQLYSEINTQGTKNLFEIAAQTEKIRLFIFASSSSVYGNGPHIPFTENQRLSPRSPYAKSKVEAEKILISLHKKYLVPTVICRFFSVYGPNGRPDMAPYLFTEAAYTGKSIIQYGDGTSARDYTYIDDVTEALNKILPLSFKWDIINIGNHSPIALSRLITEVQKLTGKKLSKLIQPLHLTESIITCADIRKAQKILKWQPQTDFARGMQKFVNWYNKYRLNQ